MKVSAINHGHNTAFKSIIPDKAAKLAYSSMLSLALLSGAVKSVDTFTRSSERQKTEQVNGKYIYHGKPVNKAQNVYMDMWGNQWVPYSQYKSLDKATEEMKELSEALELDGDKEREKYFKMDSVRAEFMYQRDKMQEEIEKQEQSADYLKRALKVHYDMYNEICENGGDSFLQGFIFLFVITHCIAAVAHINKRRSREEAEKNKNNDNNQQIKGLPE